MIRVFFNHQNLPGQFRRPMRYLRTRPDYDVVAIGAETVVRREPAALKAELDGRGEAADRSRMHCLGKVPYAACGSAPQAASLHAYPAYPLVLSRSMFARDDFETVGQPVDLDLLKPLVDDARIEEEEGA